MISGCEYPIGSPQNSKKPPLHHFRCTPASNLLISKNFSRFRVLSRVLKKIRVFDLKIGNIGSKYHHPDPWLG